MLRQEFTPHDIFAGSARDIQGMNDRQIVDLIRRNNQGYYENSWIDDSDHFGRFRPRDVLSRVYSASKWLKDNNIPPKIPNLSTYLSHGLINGIGTTGISERGARELSQIIHNYQAEQRQAEIERVQSEQQQRLDAAISRAVPAPLPIRPPAPLPSDPLSLPPTVSMFRRPAAAPLPMPNYGSAPGGSSSTSAAISSSAPSTTSSSASSSSSPSAAFASRLGSSAGVRPIAPPLNRAAPPARPPSATTPQPLAPIAEEAPAPRGTDAPPTVRQWAANPVNAESLEQRGRDIPIPERNLNEAAGIEASQNSRNIERIMGIRGAALDTKTPAEIAESLRGRLGNINQSPQQVNLPPQIANSIPNPQNGQTVNQQNVDPERRAADRYIFHEALKHYQAPDRPYPLEEMFAPENEMHRAAKEYGIDAMGAYRPFLNRATEGVETASRPSHEGWQDYFNPYEEHVTNRIMDDVNRNFTHNVLPALKNQFIRLGQHGSSRHRELVERATQDSQRLIQDRALEERAKAYNSALSRRETDAARQLEASRLFGQMGQTAQAQGLTEAATLEGIANAKRAQEQNIRDASRNQYEHGQTHPIQKLGMVNSILTNQPYGGFGIQSVRPPRTTMNSAMFQNAFGWPALGAAVNAAGSALGNAFFPQNQPAQRR